MKSIRLTICASRAVIEDQLRVIRGFEERAPSIAAGTALARARDHLRAAIVELGDAMLYDVDRCPPARTGRAGRRPSKVVRVLVEARVPLHVSDFDLKQAIPMLPTYALEIGRPATDRHRTPAARVRYRSYASIRNQAHRIDAIAEQLHDDGFSGYATALIDATRCIRGDAR